MDENSNVNELLGIYDEMDMESKRKMVAAAVSLLGVQKNLKKALGYSQESRSQTLTSYLVTGFLLLSVTLVFWIALINPALLMAGITPPIMARIIITALFGIFIIGVGFLWFLMRKLAILWMLLAVVAGALCADPRIFTDIAGILVVALIIVIQLVPRKREGTVMAG